MSTNLNKQINGRKNDQTTIADYIINGSIEIHSKEVFKGFIEKFPNNSALLRIYADILIKDGLKKEAAESYKKAAEISLIEGKTLESLIFRISGWRLSSPNPLETEQFISRLIKKFDNGTHLKSFMEKLSLQEILTFFSGMKIVKYSSGQVVKNTGDMEDSLFFILSGSVRDSVYRMMENDEKKFREPTLFLTEDNFFGQVYPFENDRKCNSHIEAIEPVELISISKQRLIQLCKKYPNIELGLIDLFKIRAQDTVEKDASALRGSQRLKMHQKLHLKVYLKHSTKESIQLRGSSSDISISGICFVLDQTSYNIYLNLINKSDTFNKSMVEVGLLVEDVTLNILGSVAWQREFNSEGRRTMSLGIQFGNLSPKLKGILMCLLSGSN